MTTQNESEEIELQSCERCGSEGPIETMTMTADDCWICKACDDQFREVFAGCTHDWHPARNSHGDEGKCCSKCSGFVCDEDMPILFPSGPSLIDGQ